jgi:hypothetical protein
MGQGSPSLLIGNPVRNQHNRDNAREKYGSDLTKAWTLPEYIDGLLRLDYPKDRITAAFLVNDCTDNSLDLLMQFRDAFGSQYRKFIIEQIDFGHLPYQRIKEKGRDYLKFAHLAKVRNTWLENCLGDEEAIFSVDTDVIVLPDTANVLLGHNVPVCSALINNQWKDKWKHFLSRCNIMNELIVKAKPPHSAHPHLPQPTDLSCAMPVQESLITGGLLEVHVTGACYIIRREVWDSGARYGGCWQGEDISFCRAARANGFQIFCDTGHRPFHYMKPTWKQELEEWKEKHQLSPVMDWTSTN